MFSTNSYAYQGLHKTSDVLNETVSNGKNFINNDLGNFSDSINTSVSILESTILNTLNGCFFLHVFIQILRHILIVKASRACFYIRESKLILDILTLIHKNKTSNL